MRIDRLSHFWIHQSLNSPHGLQSICVSVRSWETICRGISNIDGVHRLDIWKTFICFDPRMEFVKIDALATKVSGFALVSDFCSLDIIVLKTPLLRSTLCQYCVMSEMGRDSKRCYAKIGNGLESDDRTHDKHKIVWARHVCRNSMSRSIYVFIQLIWIRSGLFRHI